MSSSKCHTSCECWVLVDLTWPLVAFVLKSLVFLQGQPQSQIFIIERKKRSIFILHCTSLWIFLRGTQPYNHHGSKILPPKGFINAFLYGFETSSLQEPSTTTSLHHIHALHLHKSQHYHTPLFSMLLFFQLHIFYLHHSHVTFTHTWSLHFPLQKQIK